MRIRILLSIAAALLCVRPALSSSLQDWEFNVNGTDYFPSNGNTFASVPGLNSSAFNTTTGQGTLTLTFDPNVAGTYYVGAFFFNPAAVPFYNEYGAVNGSVASGESWQIDVPEYDVVSANHGNGTIVDDLANDALTDVNSVPGTTTNYLNNCGANGGGSKTASCNDFVSLAEGYSFTLTSTEEEVLTFSIQTGLATSNQGGITLEAIHPVDGSNATEADLYYSTSAMTIPIGPITPEPATWTLLTLAGGLLAFAQWRRRASRVS